MQAVLADRPLDRIEDLSYAEAFIVPQSERGAFGRRLPRSERR
jgi:hypothetical protein